jgi:hypothetical protein
MHSHGSNIKYDYVLRIYHIGFYQRKDLGWKNYLGAILCEYLGVLGPMLLFYQHMATLNPSPSDRELWQIPISEITDDTPKDLLEKYV